MRAPYSPWRAWLRALAYFAFCSIAAQLSGVLPGVLDSPLATAGQVATPLWWVMTVACWLVIVIGYAVIWPRGTFTDGRRRHLLLSIAYGAVWGASQALWFLTLWTLVARTGLNLGWVAGISYLLIGTYNGLWHRYFWDIYVSPPHNYTEWNARKVLFSHTPNLILCLSYLALYGNYGMFVLLQATALGISAYVMRFPAPWDDYTAVAGQERSNQEKTA